MTAPVAGDLLVLRTEGFRRLAYVRWQDELPQAHPPVVCVHGLTRNGRDFDVLARRLARGRSVYCPDVLGRGLSDDLNDPLGYTNPAYAADLVSLIARTGAAQVDWVGTSMGGLIGMILAAVPGSPLRRLVLNDVGAVVEGAALLRIKEYLRETPAFASLDALEAHLRRVHAPFGPLTDAQWAHLAEHGARRREDGRWVPAFDPAIQEVMADLNGEDIVLWPLWEAIRCPVLVIRGAHSDLLSADTLARMQATGPGCTVLEVPDAGHAPALMAPEHVEAIAAFLEGVSGP